MSSKLSRPVATVSADGKTVTHRHGAWSNTFPAGDLARWTRFYEWLRDRKRGAYARTYAQHVEALAKAARILHAMHPTRKQKEAADA